MAMASKESVGPPFVGFVIASMLFGVVLVQIYQYFKVYLNDSKIRKAIILAVCLLDVIHFAFSVLMMYYAITNGSGFAGEHVLWALKAMIVSKIALLLLVQGFYLRLIWILAGNILLSPKLSIVMKTLAVLGFTYSTVIAITFLKQVKQVSTSSGFAIEFEILLYITFASTIIVDLGIAIFMAVVLLKTKSLNTAHKSGGVVSFLVFFFFSSGLLTSITSAITGILYLCNPTTVVYLVTEFTLPHLYALSILYMFNAKSRLQKQMNRTEEFKVPSTLIFGDVPLQNEEDPDP